MTIETKHFGKVEIDESRIVTFDQGIFGFEDDKRFVIFYEDDKTESGLCWLQSLDHVECALPLVNPLIWYPEYSPEVADEEVSKLGELVMEDLNVYTVVVITDEITSMTTNLKAPIVVNLKTKKAMQTVVTGDEYQIRHNLYEQIQLVRGEDE